MILRFTDGKNYLNIDTGAEEHSEGCVTGKKYITVSDDDYIKISCELDFNQFAFVEYLVCDAPEPAHFEIRLLYDGHYLVENVGARDEENAVEVLFQRLSRAKEYEIFSVKQLLSDDVAIPFC